MRDKIEAYMGILTCLIMFKVKCQNKKSAHVCYFYFSFFKNNEVDKI